MSDLAVTAALTRTSSQLPIGWYFDADIYVLEQKYLAYNETALEDDEICRRMHQGRRELYRQGRDEAGPYQSPMEDGTVHFHEFIRREIAPHPSE